MTYLFEWFKSSKNWLSYIALNPKVWPVKTVVVFCCSILRVHSTDPCKKLAMSTVLLLAGRTLVPSPRRKLRTSTSSQCKLNFFVTEFMTLTSYISANICPILTIVSATSFLNISLFVDAMCEVLRKIARKIEISKNAKMDTFW